MDKRTEVIERLIDETGLSKKAFAEKIGLPPTTLRSMLSRGVGNASVDNVIKVCKGLGITTEDLEKLANGEELNKEDEFSAKDERDIQKELQKMIEGLGSQNGYAAFDGGTIDDMDEEDRELLIASLENSLRLAKRLAKQKFTPKKYRK